MIACTQPRRVAATSVARRVSDEMDVECGTFCGYSVRFEDCSGKQTKLKYMTDGMLLREAMTEPTLSRYGVVMLDEAHERTLSTDVLFGLLKRIMLTRTKESGDELKVVVMSATLDAEKMQKYFSNAPLISIPGRTFPVDIFYTPEPEPDYLKASVRTVLMIHTEEDQGDILLFLTGEEEIEQACRLITNSAKQGIMEHGELIALPLYSSLPPHLQQRVFEPAENLQTFRGGRSTMAAKPPRKVVVSTNVAETSLTVEGVVYVVDPGLSKQKVFNPRLKCESLLVTPISQASCKQRAGRAGRTRPGKCYRLYTEDSFKTLTPQTFPEILRANLSSTVLTLLKLGIEDLIHFDFLDPPAPETLMHALNHLRNLGALDQMMHITPMGRLIAEFPVDPNSSRVLIDSATRFSCSAECLQIVAMLSVPQVFVRGKEKERQEATASKDRFSDMDGDHLALYNVFQFYLKGKMEVSGGNVLSSGGPGFSSTNAAIMQSGRPSAEMDAWAKKNFLNLRSLTSAESVRNQLQAMMEKCELPVVSVGERNPDWNSNIRKALIGGCFQNVARLQDFEGSTAGGADREKKYLVIRDNTVAEVFPSCCLKHRPKWVLFHDIVHTSKNFLQTVTGVKPEWLNEVAGDYFAGKFVRLPQSGALRELQNTPASQPGGSNTDGIANAVNVAAAAQAAGAAGQPAGSSGSSVAPSNDGTGFSNGAAAQNQAAAAQQNLQAQQAAVMQQQMLQQQMLQQQMLQQQMLQQQMLQQQLIQQQQQMMGGFPGGNMPPNQQNGPQ